MIAATCSGPICRAIFGLIFQQAECQWQATIKVPAEKKNSPCGTLSTTNPTWNLPGSNPVTRNDKPAINRLSSISMVTKLQVERSWIRRGPRDVSQLQIVQTVPGPKQPPIQLQGLLLRSKSGRGVRLTTHFQLVPRLRLSGARPSTSPTCYNGVYRKKIIFTIMYVNSSFYPAQNSVQVHQTASSYCCTRP